MLLKKLLTTMDVDQYNICNRRNNHQPAFILILNLRGTLEKL